MCTYGIVFWKSASVRGKINMCSSLNKWRKSIYVLRGSGEINLGVGGSLGYMEKDSCPVIYKGMLAMIANYRYLILYQINRGL